MKCFERKPDGRGWCANCRALVTAVFATAPKHTTFGELRAEYPCRKETLE